MPKKPKGVGKPSAAKIAADKRRQFEENLAKAKERAYLKSYKTTLLQAARVKGRTDALKDAAKKGKKR